MLRLALVIAMATGLSLIGHDSMAAPDGLPRTPGGHPDLTGFYDAGTLTPLNRPRAFGEKAFMTREEAEALNKEC